MFELISEHACFGGVQRFYSHQSKAIGLPTRFSVFLPAQAKDSKLPALFYLAGLDLYRRDFHGQGRHATQRHQRRHDSDWIRIDQGLNDKFLADQLCPEIFEEVCKKTQQRWKYIGMPVTTMDTTYFDLRRRAHSISRSKTEWNAQSSC